MGRADDDGQRVLVGRGLLEGVRDRVGGNGAQLGADTAERTDQPLEGRLGLFRERLGVGAPLNAERARVAGIDRDEDQPGAGRPGQRSCERQGVAGALRALGADNDRSRLRGIARFMGP